MRMRQNWILGVVAVLSSLVITACGGSGGGPAGGGGGGNVSLFVVDDMNAGYDHVWVTIDKVDLVGASGPTTVFDATTTGGKVVDLRTLHDASGERFMLLGGKNTPPGAYTGINVTLASGLTIMSTGASSGVAATFAGASGGTFVMSLAFPAGTNISATNKLVIDFNLANWNLAGSSVSAANNAFLALGSAATIGDHNRHEPSDYDGTVSTVSGSAPDQTFTLTMGQNTVNVLTSATTVITNSDGSSNPSLVSGARVDVVGTFDTTNNVLDATSVRIHVGGDQSHVPLVHGLVTAFDPVANTVTVQLHDCDEVQPTSTSVTVDVSLATTFFGPTGVTDTHDQFFADLVAGTSKVYAIGSLSGSTFTASKMQLEGVVTTTPQVAMHGSASNVSSSAFTFDVSPSEVEGIDLGHTTLLVHVVTDSNTVFVNSGTKTDQATFFGTLGNQANVMVRGTVNLSTMTLTATLIGNGSSDGFHF